MTLNKPLDKKIEQTLAENILKKMASNPTLNQAIDAIQNKVELKGGQTEVNNALENYYNKNQPQDYKLEAYAATTLILKNKKIPVSNKEYSDIFGYQQRPLIRQCRKIKRSNPQYELAQPPLQNWVKRREKELLLIKKPTQLESKIKELTKKAQQNKKLQGRTNRVLSTAIIYKAVKNRDDHFKRTQKQITETTNVSKTSIQRIHQKI